MATDYETDADSRWSYWAIAAAILLLLLFSLVAAGMLRGCWSLGPDDAKQAEKDPKKKAEKKKKEDFEIAPPAVQPAELDSPLHHGKPGHWAMASQLMRANFRDFVGDSSINLLTSKNEPYNVVGTPFVLTARRPVLLTRGRPKAIESTLFIPDTKKAIRLATQLEERGLGLRIPSASSQLSAMPSYQYHFVVLAKESSRYGYVKSLDSVKVPFDGESEADDTTDSLHYRVVLMPTAQSIRLPDNPLTWTSIAYLLWDEVDPQLFTAGQQRALVDWLHWGGQLIVSGPDSLDLLKNSFLEPYLPAANSGPQTIAAGHPALAEINDAWWIATGKTQPLQPTAPWSAIELDIHPDAQPIASTGHLFAERQVGRGRVVVSALQLAERDLVNWRGGFESFFNAALLRRPPRKYVSGYFGDVTLTWADAELKARRLDARLTTQTRYLARDLGVETAFHYEDVTDEFASMQASGAPQTLLAYRAPSAAGGIGAWNDFGSAADAARTALREAAGVEVPGAGFVLLCLASYLVVLVPVNWLLFHTLGRIEWAWLAAPLIAIVGTLVIVERARLDIGFVRARTEIGLLEQQPGHPRAHLARYTALYASLSSTYELESANLTTLVAPFPATAERSPLRGLEFLNFHRYDNVRLSGLPISSNSTGMVHSEQIVTLDGPLRLGKSAALGGRQVENHTKLELHSACIVRRPTREEARRSRREFEGRWIGRMAPGQSDAVPLRMSRLPVGKVAFAAERKAEAELRGIQPLNLEPMFQLALDPKNIDEGEVRFVARVDEVLPGQNITPAASQTRGSTLVVAHLEYAPPPPPRPDVNIRQDIQADAAPPENELDFFE